MGGCCCSTRNSHMNGTPTYYYCPIAMEERMTSEINSGSSSMLLNAGHDLNLDFSIPNTYRSPPTPLPYDVVLKYPQQKDPNSAKERICGCSLKTTSAVKSVGELDRKSQDSGPPRKLEHSKSKGTSTTTPVTEEDQDVCPICLEEYDSVHPEIITKCKHHFHLACLLEWTERSDVCPICDKVCSNKLQEMIFELH
ncbi:probable E3 ubiquitin-protein ligase RHB1A isoform X1 [Cucumis melo]|uniref:RING-type E3 ubiquitin transferase n=2 Tax=Cucumis melo TaxID=3656 RepID=A0A1S4DSJ0_CUCME|nr:probable E3 ubiquitin-protein ligase RHB1A isoform X1 [Cucumis melo]